MNMWAYIFHSSSDVNILTCQPSNVAEFKPAHKGREQRPCLKNPCRAICSNKNTKNNTLPASSHLGASEILQWCKIPSTTKTGVKLHLIHSIDIFSACWLFYFPAVRENHSLILPVFTTGILRISSGCLICSCFPL